MVSHRVTLALAPPKLRTDLPYGERQEQFGKRSIAKYAPELALEICEKVAKGKILTEVCKGDGMPNRTTFWRWVMLYKDVAVAYQAARELSAQSLEDEALKMARELKEQTGFTTVRVRAYDIAMQQLRWSATRRDPSKYGQKAKETITVPIQINTTLDLGGNMSDGQGIYTIKAEIVAPTGTDQLTPPSDPERGIIAKPKKKKRKT